MAIGAAEIELALPLHVERASFGDERRKLRIGAGFDSCALRLPRDKGRERQQLAALEGERRRLLVVGAARIDALLQIDGAAGCLVESRVARGHAFHACAGIIVAIGAGLVGGTQLALPKRLAVEHPEHAGVGGILVLHRAGVRLHEVVAGATVGLRDFGGESRARDQQHSGYGAGTSHSTDIEADAVSENPWSPTHSNSNLPLSVAVVKKVMKGLAAIAGNRSARKISLPLKRHVKLVMMSRGTTSPDAIWR